MKKKKQKERNIWKDATISIMIILGLLIVFFFIEGFLIKESFEEGLCKSIQGTPAWSTQDGEIIGYGYIEIPNMSVDLVNQELIPANIYFLYNSDCSVCIKQIEYFGNTWEDYQKSGLTINCKEVL